MFQISKNEPTLYMTKKNNNILIICIFIDGIIYMGSSQYLITFIDELKLSVMMEFNTIDLGGLHYFLGLEVYQHDHGIFIFQKKDMLDMLKKFSMLNCKIVSIPINTSEKSYSNDGISKIDENFFRRIVGSLMYLTHRRPYIMFNLGLRALAWTSKSKRGRSITYFSIMGNTINYMDDKKYEKINVCTIKRVIHCDDKSTMQMMKNPVFHRRAKHAKFRYYFIGDRVISGTIEVKFCSTKDLSC